MNRWPTDPTALLRVLLAALTLALLAPRAEAADPAEKRAAKTHYRQGMAAYNRGDYEDALAAFQRAHEMDPAPMLIFNIAQAHYKLEDHDAALEHYRRYLEVAKRGATRARAEARVRELETRIADRNARSPVIPPAAKAPPIVPHPAEAPSPSPPPAVREPPPREPETSPPPDLVPVAPPPAIRTEARPGQTQLPAAAPAAPEPRAENVITAARPREQDESPPLYKRPWFWVAIGAVVVGGAVVAASTMRGREAWNCGANCSLPTYPVPGQ